MDDLREGKLLRIFVDEHDRIGIEPAYVAIVEYLRKQGVAGATVFRGVEGFGGHGEVHVASVFRWALNLPVLIEVVEDAVTIEALIPHLRAMIGEGLLTLEAASYLRIDGSS